MSKTRCVGGQAVVSTEGFMLPRSTVKSSRAQPTQKHNQHRTVKPSQSGANDGLVVSASIDSSLQMHQNTQQQPQQQQPQQQQPKRDPLVPLVHQSRSSVESVASERAPGKSIINTRHSFDSKIENLMGNQNLNSLPRINEQKNGVEAEGPAMSKETQHGSFRSSVSSSSERDVGNSKDAMRLRVKELEQEVKRLSHHAQQAEMSIRNYRGMLSDKGPSAGQRRDVGAQTDIDDAMLHKKLQLSQEKLSALTQEFQNMQSARDELFRERSRLAELARKKDEEQQQLVRAHEETIRSQQGQIDQQQQEAKQMQQKLDEQQKQVAVCTEGSSKLARNSSKIDTAHAHLLRQKLDVVRTELNTQRKEFKAQLDNVQQLLSQKCTQLINNIVSSSRRDGAAASKRIKQLIADKSEVEKRADAASKEALRLKEELLQAQSKITSLQREALLRDERQKHALEEHRQRVSDASANTSSVGVSPMKFTPMKPAVPAHTDASLSPLSPLNNRVAQDLKFKMLINEQEERVGQLEQKLEQEQQQSGQLLQRLGDATSALAGLEEVHSAELKAVKHVAHVKDLARVAKEREIAIERDRMLLEMKHLRFVLAPSYLLLLYDTYTSAK